MHLFRSVTVCGEMLDACAAMCSDCTWHHAARFADGPLQTWDTFCRLLRTWENVDTRQHGCVSFCCQLWNCIVHCQRHCGAAGAS